MKYNRQIQMVMKQQLGFSLNKYILKNNIDIKNLAVSSGVSCGSILKMCQGKKYHWSNFFKIIKFLNLKISSGLKK